ncbi:hypothetical protein ACQ4M3_36375 [Leptolyngbya sp. AN03gr2]|uniref:hypothetical protein n=1 Tax=unclassified Leptolyngbya TaxID=2650499 RepID=UPI003D31267E
MLDEMVETYDEYDESDYESDFEDLQYGEARRRPRRRRSPRGVRTSGNAWRPQPAPSSNGRSGAAVQLKREAEAGRARDKQLAREVNSTKEEIGDVESQLKKVNSDLASLRQLSLISTILPRSFDVQRQRLTITPGGDAPPVLTTTTDPNAPGVNVVSGVNSRMDILPIVLFMSMGRSIGKGGRSSSSGGMGDNSMMLVVLLMMMQQQQQQSNNPGQPSSGGLDTTSLLLVLLASGGL